MQKPPSTLLLERIRAAARRRGWNTAALAQEAGLERVELKPVLAGREPLSVDDLVALVRALELTLDELGLDENALNEVSAEASSGDQDAVESLAEELGSNETVTLPDDRPVPDAPDNWTVEPLGIHAEQVFRLGFGLGCDLFVVIDTASLEDSGVPDSILERFPERLPIKLDAAFHRHNAPRLLPRGIQLVLSFDALYTCFFPWASVLQVTFFPIAELDQEDPSDPEDGSGSDDGPEPGSHLRLVK